MLYKGDTLYVDWLEDGIAELVFDAPGSVNKLDTATVASLGQALDVLEKQSDLKGLLLRSNKAAFIVGADITEFLSLFLVPEEQLSQWLHFANSVFNRLEDLPVPTLSAVNGYALGGGCECVLATDYRLATPDLRIGLPESWASCRALAVPCVCRACWVPTARWRSLPRVKMSAQNRRRKSAWWTAWLSLKN